MNLKEAIKVMSGSLTQTQVAEKVRERGEKMTQSTLGTMLSRNNMQVATLAKIADALGYEIVLRPTGGKDKAERTVVLNELGKKEADSQ